jgi:glycosyltransferase involved in cell wall biosynthesis
MREKILIFQRLLPYYRIQVFRKICEETGAILCFGKRGPKKTYLPKVEPTFSYLKIDDFYPVKGKETLVFLNIFLPLIKFKPDIIITEFALGIISNYLLLLMKPFFKFKLILWSHGYNRKTGLYPNKFLADKLRVWWVNQANAIILYTQKGKKLISKYIRNPQKIFVAFNTLDTDELLDLRNKLERIGKERIKKDVGFGSKYNLIFIGRLLKEKEPDRLIRVFKIISKKLDDISVHFVGDGPMIDELRREARGVQLQGKLDILPDSHWSRQSMKNNIKFWGSIIDISVTGKLLFASDLMVMPGYLGLSVVHSFCFDTPVVSQKQGIAGPFHSPEVEYVVDNKTGFLVEYGNDEKMADVIIDYLLNKEKQEEMKKHIRHTVENICSLKNMLNGFRRAIEYVTRNEYNKVLRKVEVLSS